jgi:hypothetical protein
MSNLLIVGPGRRRRFRRGFGYGCGLDGGRGIALIDGLEVGREAVGVDRRHPLQEGHGGARFFLGDAQVRHLAAQSVVQPVLRIHQEIDHRLLARFLGAPGRVQPGLGQIGRVVGTVAQQGVAVHAVLRLGGQLAVADHRFGFLFGQFLAEQGLLGADHRHLEIALLVEHIVDTLVDSPNWHRHAHALGAGRDLLHRIEGEKDEYYERARRHPDGHLSPKGFGCPPRLRLRL